MRLFDNAKKQKRIIAEWQEWYEDNRGELPSDHDMPPGYTRETSEYCYAWVVQGFCMSRCREETVNGYECAEHIGKV